jgi:hypothetical protein
LYDEFGGQFFVGKIAEIAPKYQLFVESESSYLID